MHEILQTEIHIYSNPRSPSVWVWCLWNAEGVRQRRREDAWVSLYHTRVSWIGEYKVCRQHWRAQPRAEPTLKYFWGKKRKCNSRRNMNHRALLWANESIPSAFLRRHKLGLKFHLNIVENRETRLNCKKVVAVLVKIELSFLVIMLMAMFEPLTSPVDVHLLYLDSSGKVSVWLSRLQAELCCFYHIHLHSLVSKNFSQNSLN